METTRSAAELANRRIELDLAIELYCLHLKNDYAANGFTSGNTDYIAEAGYKYQHIIHVLSNGASRSSHAFIVTEDGGKFPRGTILKSASWKAPATNFGRGNVLDTKSYTKHGWAGL